MGNGREKGRGRKNFSEKKIFLQKTVHRKEKMRYYNTVKNRNGQLTQLVECFRHMEEVRGSSPLLPTKIGLKRIALDLFLYLTGRFEPRTLRKAPRLGAFFGDSTVAKRRIA